MSAGDRRSIVDRLLSYVHPVPVGGYAPPPQPLADGLWVVERKLRFPLGLLLPYNMTVVRLGDGRLLLHSPVHLDEATTGQILALGSVAAVIAPNSFHYLFASEYARSFPDCRVYLAPDLPARLPNCPAGTVLGAADRPEWSGELQHVVFGPVRNFTELVFHHRPTSTLILTDLAFNMGTSGRVDHRWVWRASGIPAHLGPSRTARLTFLSDRSAARAYLRSILQWDFDRIIVGHGDPVDGNGRAAFTAAFRDFLG